MNKKLVSFITLITFLFGMVTLPAQVFGTEPVNLALNKPATASSQNKTWEYPKNAVDGSVSTQWASATSQGQNWLQIDLEQPYQIGRWVVKNAGSDGSNPGWNNQNYSLQVSTDGVQWQTVDSVVNNPRTVDGNVTNREFEPVMARYVRHFTTEDARVRELEIYPPSGPSLPTIAGLSLTGKSVTGTTLYGSYSQFIDPQGYQESGSTATWRRANDADFTIGVTDIITQPISQGTVSSYTLTEDDIGKYIQFSVIPRSNATENYTGNEVSTALSTPVRLAVTQPKTTLTSPVSGYRVHEGTPIALSAVATCDNTEIVSISYYANDELVAQSSEAPFDAVWSNAVPGEYNLVARAYNALSESGDSPAIAIKVYGINEQIEPVWAKKWSYDFNQFTADGVYSTANPMTGNLPGTDPPTITYNNGSIQSSHGIFGKTDSDYHLQINASSSGTSLPSIGMYKETAMDKPIKTVAAEVELAFTTTTDDHYIFAYRTEYTAYNMFHFQKNGNIAYPTGAGTTAIAFTDANGQPLKYQANRWYKVGTIIDFENKQVSYFLDGEKLLTRTAPDAERYTTLSSLSFGGVRGSSSNGIMYMDNLFLGQIQDSYVNAVLTAPVDGSYHLTGSNINIKGYAKDARDDKTIQKVEFLLDGVPIDEKSGSSFDFNRSDIPAGHHILQARAISSDGMIGYSEQVAITVSAVQMPTMYGNDMLLQRNREIRLSGPGKNGETVTANLNGQSQTVQITGGRWSIVLPPQPTCKNTVLEFVTSDGVTISFDNVAIGELILLTGQSNMQYTLEKFRNLVDQADRDYDDIRLFKQSVTTASSEQTDCKNGRWTPATIIEAKTFSGMGFLTAKLYYLSQSENVPVGLVYASEGGTGIHTYAPTGAYAYDPDIADSGSTIYKSAIAPWKTFTFGQVMFYQGEANTQLNTPYEKLLTEKIDAYRKAFNDESLKFIIIQLPVYDYPAGWGGVRSAIGVRDAQFNVSQRLENVATVVGVDTGDRSNIHPDDKLPLAQRAALVLQHFTNPGDASLVWKSPSYSHNIVQDGIMTIYFKDVAGGLGTKDNQAPRGFKLADANGVFQTVNAVLDGNTVKIDVSSVTGEPKVRYAFEDIPPLDSENKRPNLNLVNSGNLPMAPFRTDSDKYNFTNQVNGVYVNPANYAPTIRWIKADYLANGNCRLTVNARDYDGTIAKLELFKENVLMGEATKSAEDTYIYEWNNATSGTFSFHAIATDDEGTTSVKAHSTMGGKTVQPQKFLLTISTAPSFAINFEGSDGKELTRFGGEDFVKALTDFGGAEAVLVLSAYKGDLLIKTAFSNTAETMLDRDALTDATEIKAFVWNNFDKMQPLGDIEFLYR